MTGVFGLDARSLVAFRIGLGFVLMVEAFDRSFDLRSLYGEGGVLPLSVYTPGGPSLPYLAGGVELMPLWLLMLAACGFALVVGWRTRAATVLAWILLVTVQARNGYASDGSDPMLAFMVLWAAFLPLGGAASFDRRAGRVPAMPAVVRSAASAAYVVQVAVFYFITFVEKRGETWWDGTAAWYAVSLDILTGPVGKALRAWPELLALGTRATMLLEAIGPWLLLVPWRNGVWRVLVGGAFVTFHLGLALTLRIGWFPYYALVVWLPLVPSALWDRAGVRTSAGPAAREGWPTRALVVSLLGVVLAWNLGFALPEGQRLHNVLGPVARPLRLDQQWKLYAPDPVRVDVWYRVEGTLPDGTVVDRFTGEAPTDAVPDAIWRRYGGSRWNKYMESLHRPWGEPLRTPYLRWHCRQQRSLPVGARAAELTLVAVKERSPPPGEEAGPRKTEALATLRCGRGGGAAP